MYEQCIFYYYSPTYVQIFLVDYFLQVLLTQLCMHLSYLYANYIPCKLHWFSSCHSNDIWRGIQFMKPNVMQTFSGIFLFYSSLVRISSSSDSTSSIYIFRLILEGNFHTKKEAELQIYVIHFLKLLNNRRVAKSFWIEQQ